jgi:hypothetical protein
MAGMVAGLVVMLCVYSFTHIAFTWYVLIGTAVTFAAGLISSPLMPERSAEPHETTALRP